MPDEQKENGQEAPQKETLSALDVKRKELLDEVNELMEQMGENFGPVFQEELQRRLEFVVQNFNEEVRVLISDSFQKWQVKDTQLRDLMDGSIQVPQPQPVKRKTKDSSTPEFIKDLKLGPVRPK